MGSGRRPRTRFIRSQTRRGIGYGWRVEVSRWTTKLVALAIVVGVAGRATAAEQEGDDGSGKTVAAAGGMVALTLAADAEIQTRWGPAIAAGVGERRGPAFNFYLGETIFLGAHWSLRPGFRFERSWQTVTGCPTGCTFDVFLAEIAIRYQAPSGFLFDFGLPAFGWIPVGPDAGDTEPHLRFYTLATGDLALVGTLLVGYGFSL
jgi:hypothetical protein